MYKRANKPRGKWMLLLHTYYLLPHAETDGHILYPFFTFLLWNKRRRAALVVARRLSFLSHTGLIYIYTMEKRYDRNYTSKRRKPNKYTHKTDRTKKRKKKGLCNNNFFPSVFFRPFWSNDRQVQVLFPCRYSPHPLLPSTHTRIQPFIRLLPPVIRCLCERETGAVCASYSLFFFPLQNLVYRGGNGTLLGSTAQHWPSPENLPIARQTPFRLSHF